MGTYLKRLAYKVVGVGVVTLAAQAGASGAFNALTFDWAAALTVSGSAAALALLEGLAGRFAGDPERPRISE